MSVTPTRPVKRRKRVAQVARDEGLVAARDLLLSEGPAAVTVANVGKRIGMSHTNVIHHFGSAGELRGALMESMVRDLTIALDDVVANVRSDTTAPAKLIDQVFDAFANGGAGQLAAWIALSGETQHLEPVRVAVRALVDAIGERIPGHESRVRAAVLLLAMCAFGDAVIGPHIRPMLDEPDDAMRTITTRMLASFVTG